MVQKIKYGGSVSYQRENRVVGDGEYGTIETEAMVKPAMLWPGLNASFGVDVEETYAEIPYTPAHGGSILERSRNVRLGENLPFHLETYPQATMDFPLLEFITGSVTGFGDEPDSMSWMKELDSKFSVFTGVMFEDYKCEIPGIGVVKETISGFAGHRADIESLGPGGSAVVSEATENTSNPRVWDDIVSIKMGVAGETDIDECISDISFGFTNEITKRTHPESALSTKICGVRVVARKMWVSLKLTLVDQTFIDLVTGPTKQVLKLVLGPPGQHQLNITFSGLYWPKYIAKVEPRELAGDTITCVVDQPTCTFSFGFPPIMSITWDFTTDAAGNASEESVSINGRINRIVTNPDNASAPTASWDLAIEDEDDVDVLCGAGANRDAGNSGASEQIFTCPNNLGVASPLTFKVSNGGNTKKGVVTVYVI